ncbi:serine/threonine-protein phosphatase 7 long form-like [Quillaja saponaria]|uniref:Serine/threonine-protein phosphatase 7 long form-like n=1 Tax=Quillaja saponaria TaxID=32244 RepID=A0AAD7QD02_QUISA|nr:serine/threonine-protein phosphatase 7 long form-like [Quillaja saponaria]
MLQHASAQGPGFILEIYLHRHALHDESLSRVQSHDTLDPNPENIFMESPTSRCQYDQLSSHVAGEASASLRPYSPINYSEAPGEDIGDGEDIPDLNVDPHFNIEVDDDDIIEAPEEDLFVEYVPNPFYTNVNIARTRAVNPVIVPNAQWELHNEFYNGMLFSTKAELKNTIKYWHIMNHVAFIVVESKKDTWDISCVYSGMTQDHYNLNKGIIAEYIKNTINEDPTTPGAVLLTMIKDHFHYSPSLSKIFKAKKKAINLVFGNWEESYNEFPRYLNALHVTNPGTRFELKVNPTNNPGQVIFQRVFWAFGPSIEAFHHCKPVFQIDGTFLCGKYTGKLLVATGVDALVERWRPETHTFHLPHGEATITLQDVSILFGLPVDGEPVSGLVSANVAIECEQLLGVVPPATAVKDNTLKISWLGLTFQNFPADGDDITAQRYARAYILQLMGGLLFTSKTSTHVHICFLSLLENLYVAGQYNWGSASLAWLYREICHATHLDASEIAGPLILLQVWAWERLPFLAPRRETDIPWDNLCPLGARWRIGDVLGVAHGYAAHTTEYNEWYRHINRRYLTRVGLIHADPAPSHSTHSTSSSSLSSQRRRHSRTDVPGPSISYGRVDADVRPSDVYIPSPAHMSPPPYMASSSSMYH